MLLGKLNATMQIYDFQLNSIAWWHWYIIIYRVQIITNPPDLM